MNEKVTEGDVCSEGFLRAFEPQYRLPVEESQVVAAQAWLREFAVKGTLWTDDDANTAHKDYPTSYGMKHSAERWAGQYISNGALIVAALREGFDVKPVDDDHPNAVFRLFVATAEDDFSLGQRAGEKAHEGGGAFVEELRQVVREAWTSVVPAPRGFLEGEAGERVAEAERTVALAALQRALPRFLMAREAEDIVLPRRVAETELCFGDLKFADLVFEWTPRGLRVSMSLAVL